MARAKTPFCVGDKVRNFNRDVIETVSWVSKGATRRDDQLIATEYNDYANPYSSALSYSSVLVSK